MFNFGPSTNLCGWEMKTTQERQKLQSLKHLLCDMSLFQLYNADTNTNINASFEAETSVLEKRNTDPTCLKKMFRV